MMECVFGSCTPYQRLPIDRIRALMYPSHISTKAQDQFSEWGNTMLNTSVGSLLHKGKWKAQFIKIITAFEA